MAVERKVWRYQRGNQKPGTDNIMAKKENGKRKNNGQQKIENTDI